MCDIFIYEHLKIIENIILAKLLVIHRVRVENLRRRFKKNTNTNNRYIYYYI